MTNPHRQVTSAVLLAAGRGMRLKPHTDHIPKPLLPYDGEPTLAWLLKSLQQAGITHAVIVTHHLEEQIHAFVEDSESRWGIQTQCVHQSKLDGTATAVQVAVSAVPEWFSDYFLVTATDYLTDARFYANLLSFHQQHQHHISVSLKKLGIEELSKRSSVRYSGDFEITEVVEKPAADQAPSSYSANLLYVLPSSLIPYISKVQPSPRGERELQSAINNWMHLHGNARGLLQPTPLEWEPG